MQVKGEVRMKKGLAVFFLLLILTLLFYGDITAVDDSYNSLTTP